MTAEPELFVHLDPVGGMAGDMFVAACCHARPELRAEVEGILARAALPEGVQVQFVPDRRGGIAGMRFSVRVAHSAPPAGALCAVLERLAQTPLPCPVRNRARAIYRRLGEAEAAVHGVPFDAVHFHELAGWDSFVDILAAAAIIEALPKARWSVGPLPTGAGFVASEHGLLPVPAPATLALLEGFAWLDDGIDGERVTPTGAAILAELAPAARLPARPLRLAACGYGLGSRELAGKPNVLRARLFAASASVRSEVDREWLAVLRFEVDDQTGEDLALGLKRLRGHHGVLDVCQWPVVGKAGRLASAVQILCTAEEADAVARACLLETTTLGVRIALLERYVLPRTVETVSVDGRTLRIKRAARPDGTLTAKVELRDLAQSGLDAGGRARLRRRAEARALGEEEKEG